MSIFFLQLNNSVNTPIWDTKRASALANVSVPKPSAHYLIMVKAECETDQGSSELSTSSIEINEAGSADSPSPADQDSHNIGSKPESLNPPEVTDEFTVPADVSNLFLLEVELIKISGVVTQYCKNKNNVTL